MQLFSRKKALIAASLSALVALGACGDNVTVPVTPAASVLITITPPSLNMNVGERANFAVSITGGSTTTPPTLASCTSSNTAVATAASAGGNACAVTAVAPGNATITAATSTNQAAAAAVTVAAVSPAITSLAVSPSAAQLAIGQSVTLVPTVSPAGRTVAYTYVTSSAAIATVSAAGIVAAIAPGVATITVTANGTGAGFGPATISQAVTITVSDRVPGLTALNVQPNSLALSLGQTSTLVASSVGPSSATAAITFGTNNPAVATVGATSGVVTAVGPGSAVITVTATSPQAGSFAASTITALVPVTVAQAAQVIINSLTDNGATIDITNVIGQFEVNLSLQPNGQNVRSVQAFVCDASAAVCPAAGQMPAAQQTYGPAGGQAGFVQLYINSAEFTTPDFVTGADANTLFKNGLKTIVATTTVAGNPTQIASNNLSQINFNNPDGWTAMWTQPLNSATDVAGNTWYGGPSTPDALLPNSRSGTGSFVVVPVLYTPNRTIFSATLNFAGITCSSGGASLTDSIRPFGATYGTTARSTAQATLNFNCSGAVSNLAGYSPAVVASIDNNNAGGPTASHALASASAPAAATSIFSQITAANVAAFAQRYRVSLAYRPTTIYVPGDYQAPVITAFDIRGGAGGGTFVDSAWVNGAYFLAGRDISTATSLGSTQRYRTNGDGGVGNGVGLLGAEFGATAATRNTLFNICATPTPVPSASNTTAATRCTTPAASGGILSTIGTTTPALPESQIDFTNGAYYAQAIETDRLGNRATSEPFGWANSNGTFLVTAGLNTTAANPSQFGADLTAPILVMIPNSGTGSVPTFVVTDADSIFSALQTFGGLNNANAQFGVRFTDSRSGFFTCTTLNCTTQGGLVRGGTFQIVRRRAPSLPSLLNDAVVENLTGNNSGSSTSNAPINQSINADVNPTDNSQRQFFVNIFGDPTFNRVPTGVQAISAAQAGYYTFSGTIIDRAGNTTTIPNRSVAIDNVNPQVTGLTVPPVLTGGLAAAFNVTGTDDLEAIAGDLALNYTQLGLASGVGPAGGPTSLRFRRVPNFSTAANLGFWHNPFAALTDNKLATPVGAGTLLGSTPLNLPTAFIQNIVTTDAGGAPLAQAQTFGFFGNAAFEPRPNAVTAVLYDIRATGSRAWTGGGASAPLTATIFGGQIPTPASTTTGKDWTASGAGIQLWQGFNLNAGTTVEYRAQTSTSITNPPFTSVAVIRQAGAEWEYLGQATFAGQLDQGGNRFWRYTFAFAGQAQGAGVTMAALANGDVIRAIGLDGNGNGLSSVSSTFGLASALPAGTTITGTGPLTITNAGPPVAVTLGVSANPNLANLAFTCSANSSFVTASLSGNVCTLTPNGTVTSGTVAVTVTYTVTGSVGGFQNNTISTNVTITRTP